ncbi:MAG: cytochrome c oxidase subunit II [Chloroflexi bacterium]|nr:MAG: cytochrome c oxidase subunit II [Chloroflexota bacterium]
MIHKLPTLPLVRAVRLAGAALLLGILAGCSTAPSALEPQGPAAAEIAGLSRLLFVMGGAVYLAVMGFLGVALLRRSRRQGAYDEQERRTGNRILTAGVTLTVVILLVVFGFTVSTQVALSLPAKAGDLTIRVIGRQWWWEVQYPTQQITTANEIHIPVGRPVKIELLSEDVIHSFWVPELHGKLDMIPGETNVFWIEADHAGDYWGLCAEFCGMQHAKMQFLVVAVPPEEYDAWVARQQQPARPPADDLAARGQEVFLGGSCIYCHTISGTDATGRLGPDLTHLASRRTLGAGALPNNRGNLGGWVVDSQHIKPGNLMPATAISGDDLQALLAYLEGLH